MITVVDVWSNHERAFLTSMSSSTLHSWFIFLDSGEMKCSRVRLLMIAWGGVLTTCFLNLWLRRMRIRGEDFEKWGISSHLLSSRRRLTSVCKSYEAAACCDFWPLGPSIVRRPLHICQSLWFAVIREGEGYSLHNSRYAHTGRRFRKYVRSKGDLNWYYQYLCRSIRKTTFYFATSFPSAV